MGILGLSQNKSSYTIQYRLHIVCVVEDWNQMQHRNFIAADIQNQLFYRVHEVIGGWGESRYIIESLEKTELKRLFDLASMSCVGTNSEPFNDWSAFATSLQNAEVVEITKEQILRTRKE